MNDRPVLSDRRKFATRHGLNITSLTVDKPEQGVYKCTARNPAGISTSYGYICVNGERGRLFACFIGVNGDLLTFESRSQNGNVSKIFKKGIFLFWQTLQTMKNGPKVLDWFVKTLFALTPVVLPSFAIKLPDLSAKFRTSLFNRDTKQSSMLKLMRIHRRGSFSSNTLLKLVYELFSKKEKLRFQWFINGVEFRDGSGRLDLFYPMQNRCVARFPIPVGGDYKVSWLLDSNSITFDASFCTISY